MVENRTFPLRQGTIRADALSPTSVPDGSTTPNPPIWLCRPLSKRLGLPPLSTAPFNRAMKKGPDRHGDRDPREAMRATQMKG